jgi:outer membrane protein
MKRLIALCALPSLLTAQAGARSITLDEAIRLAQQNAPSTVSARGQIRASDAAVRTAFSTFLPTFSMSAGASSSDGENLGPNGRLVPISTPWSFSRGLNSNLELFDAGRRLFNLRNAQAEQDAAEASERLSNYRVALDVSQQYFNILAARESRGAAQAQFAQADQQLKVASARVAAGAATKSDSLRSVIAVGNAQLSILNAENNIRVAAANLTRLAGTTFDVTAVNEEGAEIPVVRLDSAAARRLIEESPAVVAARYQAAATAQARRSARTTYWPTLSLGYGLSGQRTDQAFAPTGGPFSSLRTLRFNFNYQLFNGLGREENQARASIAETNALAQLRDARLAADQQVTQLLGALNLAEARIAIQLASVEAGEEDLRVQNQRYALGSSTLLDVLTSQSTLNQARFSLIQARYDARVAKAQIEALLGRNIP